MDGGLFHFWCSLYFNSCFIVLCRTVEYDEAMCVGVSWVCVVSEFKNKESLYFYSRFICHIIYDCIKSIYKVPC